MDADVVVVGAGLAGLRCALAPGEEEVRRPAAELLGADASGWDVVARHVVPHALPAQPAPYSARRPAVRPDGLVVCGDHVDTGSIQGALVSGRRAAAAVEACLR